MFWAQNVFLFSYCEDETQNTKTETAVFCCSLSSLIWDADCVKQLKVSKFWYKVWPMSRIKKWHCLGFSMRSRQVALICTCALCVYCYVIFNQLRFIMYPAILVRNELLVWGYSIPSIENHKVPFCCIDLRSSFPVEFKHLWIDPVHSAAIFQLWPPKPRSCSK